MARIHAEKRYAEKRAFERYLAKLVSIKIFDPMKIQKSMDVMLKKELSLMDY